MAYGCEWFKFYDFVEEMCRSLSNSTAEHAEERSAQFQDALNEFFVDEGIGWQMIDGEVVTRGTETFESNVHGAVDALKTVGRARQATKYMRL